MGLPIIDAIGGLISAPLKDLTETRKETKAARIKLEQTKLETKAKMLEAKANLASAQSAHTANWEIIQAQQAATSWKDEYLTVLITSPMAITFIIPVLAGFVGNQAMVERIQNAISEGWDQLMAAPQEYWMLTAGTFAATFGLRGLAKFWK